MSTGGRRPYDPGRFRAAKEALPFETPKLAVMAVSSLSGKDFATMLDRAIAASGKAVAVQRIEARPAEAE
jgi:hypothetical protein